MEGFRNMRKDYAICCLKVSRDRAMGMIIGSSLLIFFPLLHIGYFNLYLWVPYKEKVDRKRCRCSCFDTVFKGTYESQDVIRYKHVYFNATQQTLIIWSLTVLYMILFYESVRYLVSTYLEKRLRWQMGLLFLCSIHSHYYSWWAYFGYYNDDFYSQYYHQLFFTVTELISTFFVLHMCSRSNKATLPKVAVVAAIAIVHITLSFIDQFVVNVLLERGRLSQILRDIALFVPDLMLFVMPVFVWRRNL